MAGKYVVALDQGTTSSRSMLIDHDGRQINSVQRRYDQIYPYPGWVEQNPQEIIFSQLGSMTDLLTSNDLKRSDIDCIGITNQRETTILWDKETGRPIANAIVWQCRRTAPIIEALCSDPAVEQRIIDTTGLKPDSYFSASKIKWLLDNVEDAKPLAEEGRLLFGTVDTWLIWNLTGRKVHATDVTNASRTMLFDIHEGKWDPWLLDLFGIPEQILPEVKPSACEYGVTDYPNVPEGIPICGVAGDQQAALFGQCCFEAGHAKNTYGTGCFLLLHTGNTPVKSKNGLVTTIAASAPGTQHLEYALEGSVFMGGALIQWVCEELGFAVTPMEAQKLAESVDDAGGVYIVPAFTGLGAPYWKPDARGAIYGVTRGTGRAHIARAAVEALAYQVYDLAQAMQADAGLAIRQLNVDGGASVNDLLLQFQSDISQMHIQRPVNVESTAFGAAYLAGLTSGFWSGLDVIRSMQATDAVFDPKMHPAKAEELLDGWHDAVRRTC